MIFPLESYFHLITSASVFLLGYLIVMYLGSRLRLGALKVTCIYLWHTIFALLYMFYVLNNGGDSIGYYRGSISYIGTLNIGTDFIFWFCGVLYHYFYLSLLGQFLFFNIIGTIGILFLLDCIHKVCPIRTPFLQVLSLLVTFMPSLHFWTSAIGKEPIAFLAVVLTAWSMLNLRKHQLTFFIGLFLMFLVRAHIAGVLVLSYALTQVINFSNYKTYRRLAFMVVSVPVVVLLFPLSLNYAGLEMSELSIKRITEYIELRQSYNMIGGGGIDLRELSIGYRAFTYLFRPLPFESHNLSALFSSIDNLILLILVLFSIKSVVLSTVRLNNRMFYLFYIVLTTIILSSTTANLGISVRQKWMIWPLIIIVIFAVSSKYKVGKLMSPKSSI